VLAFHTLDKGGSKFIQLIPFKEKEVVVFGILKF
jgi:hypothetical protein